MTMCNNKHVESTMADCHDSTRSPASNTSEKMVIGIERH